MQSVEDINVAIAVLSPSDRDVLWRWMNRRPADLGAVDAAGNDVWDRQMIADADAGRLDDALARADADLAAGDCSPCRPRDVG